MQWSLTLGTVRGIKIKIHLTFLLLVAWAAYNYGASAGRGWQGSLYGVLITLALFFCVVLHELSHSLVALRYGGRVREIELSPIGGVSKMETVPEKPSQEFVMALAGPMVNLVIAVPLGLLVLMLIINGTIRSPSHLVYLLGRPSWAGLVANLFLDNVLLALFNLLPAFPMDGGRVLRSTLAWRLGPRQATRIATGVGQGVAMLLGLAGVFTSNWVLVFIAVFVFAGAQQEGRMNEVLAVLGDLRVEQALITACQPLSPDDSLDMVLEHTLHGHPACYGVMEGERLVGLLSHEGITSALATYGHTVHVRDVMQRDYPSVSPTDTIAKAWRLMATSGRRALPVVEDRKLLGMVTAQQIGEIYSFLAARQRQERGLR